MKISHRFIGMTLALALFAGCHSQPIIPSGGPPVKDGDGFISFNVQGNLVFLGDSICGEAMPDPISAEFRRSDSTFFISGRNCSGTNSSIRIILRANFDTSTVKLVAVTDSLDDILQSRSLQIGNATLHLLPDGIYSTDSAHTGIIKITSINSLAQIMRGTFSFTALKISGNASLPSTIRVDSGIISQLRINIF